MCYEAGVPGAPNKKWQSQKSLCICLFCGVWKFKNTTEIIQIYYNWEPYTTVCSSCLLVRARFHSHFHHYNMAARGSIMSSHRSMWLQVCPVWCRAGAESIMVNSIHRLFHGDGWGHEADSGLKVKVYPTLRGRGGVGGIHQPPFKSFVTHLLLDRHF